MKKLFIGIFAASMMFGFTSCTKDYTCECSGGTLLPDQDYPLENAKKDDAEAACDTWDTQWTADGGGCTLK